MPPRLIALLGSTLAGFAVAIGAFGAHGLRAALSPTALMTYETAVRYQMWHGLALVGVALLSHLIPSANRPLHIGAAFLFGGTLVFSGSLYAIALTGVSSWGAVAPLGGVSLILGWVLVGYGSTRLGNAKP